jgi:hypothetical protein
MLFYPTLHYEYLFHASTAQPKLHDTSATLQDTTPHIESGKKICPALKFIQGNKPTRSTRWTEGVKYRAKQDTLLNNTYTTKNVTMLMMNIIHTYNHADILYDSNPIQRNIPRAKKKTGYKAHSPNTRALAPTLEQHKQINHITQHLSLSSPFGPTCPAPALCLRPILPVDGATRPPMPPPDGLIGGTGLPCAGNSGCALEG